MLFSCPTLTAVKGEATRPQGGLPSPTATVVGVVHILFKGCWTLALQRHFNPVKPPGLLIKHLSVSRLQLVVVVLRLTWSLALAADTILAKFLASVVITASMKSLSEYPLFWTCAQQPSFPRNKPAEPVPKSEWGRMGEPMVRSVPAIDGSQVAVAGDGDPQGGRQYA